MILKSASSLTLLSLLAAPAWAIAPASTVSTYQYGGISKRDPFRPFAIAAPTLQTLSQLQEADLKDLKLVGTILGNEMSALVVTPKGDGIIARVGDKIGKTGRIVAIIQDKIIVRQPIGEPGKSQRFEDVVITLQRRGVDSNSSQSRLQPGAKLGMPGSAPLSGLPGQSGGTGSGNLSSFIPPAVNGAPATTNGFSGPANTAFPTTPVNNSAVTSPMPANATGTMNTTAPPTTNLSVPPATNLVPPRP